MAVVLLQSTGAEIGIKVGIWLIQVLLGLGIAIGSIYIAFRLLAGLTKGIDEEEEVSRGNRAVAALTFGVFIAVALVTSSGIGALTDAITNVKSGAGAGAYGRAVGFGLLQLVASLILSVVSTFMAFRVWDKLTPKIPAVQKLKEDNLAVGIMWAGVIIAVALVIREAVSGLGAAISGVGS